MLSCGLGYDLKTISEGNLLYDSVSTRGGDGIYTKVDSRGASGYYILDTILTNFNEGASVIISTHLISDVERILDEVIFIDKGKIILTGDADKLRKKNKSSIDELFRRKFKC